MGLFNGKSKQSVVPEAINAPVSSRRFFPENLSGYQLLVPMTGRTWHLREGLNRIGRGLDNDVVLSDPTTSRHHARLFVDGGSIYIEDLRSMNGTYVGGERVKSSIILLDAVFKLGALELVVRKPSALECPTPGGSWMIHKD